ncbi:MAG: hypothetical protein QM778_06390 [Myxococcales bacterium]
MSAQLLRGPEFRGELPEELALECLKHQSTVKLDQEHRAALVLPRGVDGWCQVSGAGTRALIYVKPAAELKVKLAAEHPRYAPGQWAKLEVQTLVSGHGGRAAVGLFGVDQSLGQLARLPAPDDMSGLAPRVETSEPAFGSLDGQALALGRIVGANAAAATVLRVNGIPSTPELEASVGGQTATHFDPVEELTDRFYAILPELYAQARAWERAAKPGDKMRPATMASLWNRALSALEARKQRVDDAYGRRLRLRQLPADLLALTAPHVVVGGAYLPEDVENWAAWVQKEKP